MRLVPLTALVLQAWLPRVLGRYAWFDLPLVVTVYFALGRRSPIQGTLMGAAMGLFEDALTHHAIGVNGIAKTVVGFLAASVGIRIDVENLTIRLMFNFLALRLLASVDLPLCLSHPAWPGSGLDAGSRNCSRLLGTRSSHWSCSHCSTGCRSTIERQAVIAPNPSL